jgi:hypothetical protein
MKGNIRLVYLTHILVTLYHYNSDSLKLYNIRLVYLTHILVTLYHYNSDSLKLYNIRYNIPHTYSSHTVPL